MIDKEKDELDIFTVQLYDIVHNKAKLAYVREKLKSYSDVNAYVDVSFAFKLAEPPAGMGG